MGIMTLQEVIQEEHIMEAIRVHILAEEDTIQVEIM